MGDVRGIVSKSEACTNVHIASTLRNNFAHDLCYYFLYYLITWLLTYYIVFLFSVYALTNENVGLSSIIQNTELKNSKLRLSCLFYLIAIVDI